MSSCNPPPACQDGGAMCQRMMGMEQQQCYMNYQRDCLCQGGDSNNFNPQPSGCNPPRECQDGGAQCQRMTGMQQQQCYQSYQQTCLCQGGMGGMEMPRWMALN